MARSGRSGNFWWVPPRLYASFMPSLYPLVFESILVEKPWGGRRLASFGKDLPPQGSFGESWELADLDLAEVAASEVSKTIVRDGALRGRTLQSLMAEFGSDFLGSAAATEDGAFPLLLKLLDAREHLSVQVHPTAEYVAAHSGSSLKTESWYIMSAEPESLIYLGFRAGVTLVEVADALGTPAVVELMRAVPAVAGEFHHLPAGTIHALGAGVLVAEPQTPSDTTFRLYDWVELYPRAPRELHLKEGLEVLELNPAGLFSLAAMQRPGVRTLIESDHYWQREHRRGDGGFVTLRSTTELRIVTALSGKAAVSFGGEVVQVDAGDSVVIPAACAAKAQVAFYGEGSLIETGLSFC